MARGPKPAPEVVRAAKSPVRSQRKKEVAVPEKEAVAALAGPTPPAWLKDEALAIWNRLAPTLTAAKLLTQVDVNAFARYCRNFGRWLKLQETLDGDGGMTYSVSTASGEVHRVRPEFMICDRLERQMVPTEDRFGLNPAERQRIMAARSQTGVSADLFGGTLPPSPKPADKSVAIPAPVAENKGPVGLLN